MLKVVMIRHFATSGNLQKRYIGTTDEPLCEEGRARVYEYSYPSVEAVYASPLRRCIETAELIYPDREPRIYHNFRECDFGEFENKNYMELTNDPMYQTWIDSGGTISFPNGEHPEEFKLRCNAAFDEMVENCLENGYETVAMVVHGGTIMSILEKYAEPHADYFHWQVENGGGYLAVLEDSQNQKSSMWKAIRLFEK